jgi:phosphate transport system substrate-binding protein
MTRPRRIAAGMALSGALAVMIPAAAQAIPTITMSGATGSAPLLQQLIPVYIKSHPRQVRIRFAQGGGEVGVQDVSAGSVTIGDAARDPKPSTDAPGLVFYPIAKDAFCFDVNPSNKLAGLTTAQAKAIWSGSVRNWSQVPGATANGTIDLIGRTSASSLPPLVASILLAGGKVSPLAELLGSDGLVENAVSKDPNAIGYNSGFYAGQTKFVHALAYNGITCDLHNARSGQYPGVRTYYEVTKGRATGQTAKFITWMRTNKAAKKIINAFAIQYAGPPLND